MNFFQSVANATRRHGFNPIVGDIQKKQAQWYNWYRGDVNQFHTFTQKINGKAKTFERQTLNMPKKICEDYTSLIWNERCQIKLENERAQEIVNKVLKDNSFDTDYTNLLEISFGMGMGYTIEYLDGDKTRIDYVNFQNALPLEFENSKVTSLLTLGFRKVVEKDKEYYITHFQYHMIENGYYTLKHETYVSDNSKVLGIKNNRWLRLIFTEDELRSMLTEKEDVSGKKYYEYEVSYNTHKPCFQVHGPNIKNHYDPDAPYRISIYATMLGYFRVADVLFDMLMSEAVDNRTRIIIDHQALLTKFVENPETGETEFVNYFDENDTAFMGIPLKHDDSNQKAIEYLQGDFRMVPLDMALNKILRLIGFRASLGKGYYTFEDGQAYQNEKSVIYSNADTFKSKKKHEMVIGEALEDMVRSILFLEKETGRYFGDPYKEKVEIIFDDSIVEDDTAQIERYIELARDGFIPKYKAVAAALKISDEEAKQMVVEADREDDLSAMIGIEAVDDE